jgi:hypothetical protein
VFEISLLGRGQSSPAATGRSEVIIAFQIHPIVQLRVQIRF